MSNYKRMIFKSPADVSIRRPAGGDFYNGTWNNIQRSKPCPMKYNRRQLLSGTLN